MKTIIKKSAQKKVTDIVTSQKKPRPANKPTLAEQIANLADIGDFEDLSEGTVTWEGRGPNNEVVSVVDAINCVVSYVGSIEALTSTVADIGDRVGDVTSFSDLQYASEATNVSDAIVALDGALSSSDSNLGQLTNFVNPDLGINIWSMTEGSQATTVTEALSMLDGNITHTDAECQDLLGILGTGTGFGPEAQISESWQSVLDQITGSDTTIAGVINETLDRINTVWAAGEITLQARETAESGYFATYDLFQGGTGAENLRGTINIPKDFLVKSATLNTVTTADQPVAGYVVGDKYIDFTINTVDASETAQHIYLNVKDLVDVYTAQASAAQVQVAISANNVISASIVAGSIGTTELSSGVNASLALADSAIQGATDSAQIDMTVTNKQISATIIAGSVTATELADGAVTTVKLYDSAVTSTKIADNAVTSAKIMAGAVGSAAIAIEDEDVPGDIYTVTIKSGRLILRKIVQH